MDKKRVVSVHYSYVCACGRDPISGDLKTGEATAKSIFEIIDNTWKKVHNRQGCTPPNDARTLKPRGRKPLVKE